jgi:hypothetical protein
MGILRSSGGALRLRTGYRQLPVAVAADLDPSDFRFGGLQVGNWLAMMARQVAAGTSGGSDDHSQGVPDGGRERGRVRRRRLGDRLVSRDACPGYYRTVFRYGDSPDFNAVEVGVGLGLTQGLMAGVAVGCVVVLAVAWHGSRRRTVLNQVLGSPPSPCDDADG